MTTLSPPRLEKQSFTDPEAAWACLAQLYHRNCAFIRSHLEALTKGTVPAGRVRAYYPQVEVRSTSYSKHESTLPYGYLHTPGIYRTTVTAPDLFKGYLIDQFSVILTNHGGTIDIVESDTPLPLHFALNPNDHLDGQAINALNVPLRDVFDVPDLANTDDEIANGTYVPPRGGPYPLSAFTGPRVDYSLQRLSHYTGTSPEHFQNFVIFTNYQFYIDEFCAIAKSHMAKNHPDYLRFIEPGNVSTDNMLTGGAVTGSPPIRTPQMPAYHLVGERGRGITMVNIGVGPSNAKTITDHIAVLRPHAWIMLGHCAGLRNSQELGDYVLAHAYVREDHVLDADLPLSVPIPALAEIQVALEQAVHEITDTEGVETKKIMRTGTVATFDNRNWELWDQAQITRQLSQSRAVALDMESATIAANGFRFRVPYGTLLCVSDKPLHGELKLPGMASDFYRTQVNRHLQVGLRAMEILRDQPAERLHSRKLRSFAETAFQ
ncbi:MULTISPECIES: AMP nucleosidase [unclassified Devosia]|uniref:AMP nucleosidase n=1 Tax=unclassified Devosia TaxID=196773 RepID=UPI00145EAC7F|nr:MULTISPECIES: AMP nucleosidase [unclassified Devosia]MBJ6986244.1 AMP nucleosidase [Devosia sp. MC521]MBJ7576356.1 AMP nucleosidase [Devosia sp. MC532]MBK1793044.1 AMP nucleosidase [Devosia sp. WQ 349K1]QMW64272.1 AMP nucleosidase [Devosia sp. MC521]